MAIDAFISYSNKDKSIADASCAALEATGIRCWIAPRDIRPGADWAGSIIAAIDHCRVMILIFSSSANESKQIRREIQRAVDNEVPVVPVRIEDVTPTETLAYYMAPVHWLDALTPPFEKHLKELGKTVKAILHAQSELPPETPPRPLAVAIDPRAETAVVRSPSGSRIEASASIQRPDASIASAPAEIASDARPRLPRGVRLVPNEAQGGWVLLAPERIFKADAIAVEIIKRCTGEATFGEIIDDLVTTYSAPREKILADVTALLRGLADKRLLEL